MERESRAEDLYLTVGPGMTGFGQPMLDIEMSASHLERMATKGHVVIALKRLREDAARFLRLEEG